MHPSRPQVSYASSANLRPLDHAEYVPIRSARMSKCTMSAQVRVRSGPSRPAGLTIRRSWVRTPPTPSKVLWLQGLADPVHLDDDDAFAADVGQVDEH